MTMSSTMHAEPLIASESGRIVVEYDGSAASSNAVDWAALEAAARGWPLCLIGSSATESSGIGQAVRRIAGRLHDNLGISVLVIDRATIDSPIEGVTGNDLFVLGPSPPNCPLSSLHRSVAPTASRRSPCPVVMVRGSFTRRIRRILVGVDGSSAAEAAIDWACDEAMIHGADLLVVHVCEPGTSQATGDLIVDNAMDKCRRRVGPASTHFSAQGSPSALMLALTRDRDLVVVGSRGLSGFKTVLFGSVAVGLADHAFCPVVITHPRPQRDREERPDGATPYELPHHECIDLANSQTVRRLASSTTSTRSRSRSTIDSRTRTTQSASSFVVSPRAAIGTYEGPASFEVDRIDLDRERVGVILAADCATRRRRSVARHVPDGHRGPLPMEGPRRDRHQRSPVLWTGRRWELQSIGNPGELSEVSLVPSRARSTTDVPRTRRES
jgi:nucleotide-binding universal stress UspA family protein